MFHDKTRHVWKLKKTLYGMKQAAHDWLKAFVVIVWVAFDRCRNPGVFVSNVPRCFTFLWVDELLLSSEKKLLQPLVDRILGKFDGRDLKELSHVRVMKVKRDRAKALSILHKL